MALGKRKREQQDLWVATSELPKSPGHPIYAKLNGLLAESDFDAWSKSEPYYGRHGSTDSAGHLLGCSWWAIRGLNSQRPSRGGSDSRSLQSFLGLSITEPPDHSSLTVIRKRLPGDHEQCSLG
jgi:hypothetical protein